jgi:protein-tyrosine phosphatase
MSGLVIAELAAGAGRLGLCPMPGRGGDYAGDLATLLAWTPALVLTMTERAELHRAGAGALPDDLARAGIAWHHLPIPDFNAPPATTAARWPDASDRARRVLAGGGGVLAHCHGGCGRSGMAVLRLLVELGEAPESALARLRAVRPCAVETDAQFAWAVGVTLDQRLD